ncbi:Dihydrodipicolinate synthase [Deinococcus proteolyticus MRP]|uniref:4-hydroxy-tetrahydrodipicolinate synthase n=1 Tax=Deinococcus proteolyticus (strain ATCC 35074 / DSM 20540 / JCM 6276 / NBRC 101906 / NCIMB 13154 / VKM Ac-1939 / CCM 2703 / MRP) TaxID=693977 RepID=F0RJ87_DEIPM|nr:MULTISPECIES: 4-hydroxy-tetrahydrodipicolinate synthase [Deinococcus]ADY26524.1 Dihydrodipicolinate synthase [Deinococcus proteolyticus MRP]MCY1702644.1 4-hydroxy-tetrahydrodipicolinate synthase [Deinococcus sp. SL84]
MTTDSLTPLDLSGVYTALVTPFTLDGWVDEAALADLIEYQIESGVSGLVPCGTTGESPTLTHAEHDHVVDFTVRQAAGRVPVIAGTGSNSTAEAIQLSQHAEMSGVDGVLLINPYYNKPTQKGLYEHFRAVAEAVNIPVVLYNIASRTAVNIETPTLVRLAQDCPNIKGVKEASGNLRQMADVIGQRLPGFQVVSGDDNMVLDLVEAGGHGVISVASNIIPAQMAELVRLARAGQLEEARTLEATLADFFRACFCETNPIPIKTALAEYGWCEETFRLPMTTLEDEAHRGEILAALSGLDVRRGAKGLKV